MKRCIIFGSFIIGLFSECFANDLVQNVEKNTPVKDRSQWKEYSHWSIGANMGMPFMSAKTFSSLPEHSFWAGILGYSPGFQVTYQLNPYFGLTFNMDFNHIDMIPRRRVTEIDAVLQQNGMSREGKLGAPNANEEYLKNLVVINNYFTFGLGFDFNLVNMFSPNRYKPTRFAFILSPHVCLYAFNPTLYYEKEQSKEFKYSKPAIGPIVGLGASTRLLYRASKLVDVQMRIYSGWVFSNTADGVDCSALPEENQGIAKWNLHISAGVVFKLNGKNKRDNIIWCPQTSATMGLNAIQDTFVLHDTITIQDTLVRNDTVFSTDTIVKIKESVQGDEIVFPTIYYVLNKNRTHSKEYQEELVKLLSMLKQYSDVRFRIVSYTDKCGTKEYNKRLSTQRANNLKRYLIRNGISPKRILGVKGMGADTTKAEDVCNRLRRTIIIPEPVHQKKKKLVFPTLYYVPNKSNLNEKVYQERLDKLVAMLKEYSNVKFSILSYTDRCGNSKSNRKISTQRANNMKKYLIKNGISEDRIVRVKGMGADMKSRRGVCNKARRTIIVPENE